MQNDDTQHVGIKFNVSELEILRKLVGEHIKDAEIAEDHLGKKEALTTLTSIKDRIDESLASAKPGPPVGDHLRKVHEALWKAKMQLEEVAKKDPHVRSLLDELGKFFIPPEDGGKKI
jgi:hypothetical protein